MIAFHLRAAATIPRGRHYRRWPATMQSAAWVVLTVLLLSSRGTSDLSAASPAPQDGPPVIFHITDTHVCASSACDTPKRNLAAWIAFANATSELAGMLNSGDLVEWADSQADFDAYFNRVLEVEAPLFTAPGNHDYQSHTGQSYAGYGYPRYSSHIIGDFMLVGLDSVTQSFDYTTVENLLKQNGGRHRLGVVEHYPLYVPIEVTCGGAPCSPPTWALTKTDADKLKDLAARYDVEVFFVGHDHAFFYTRDKDVYFEQIAAADLGLGNQYVMLYEDSARLAFGNNKNNGSPVFAPITPQRWDGLNLQGKILTPDAVRVKALGQISSAQFQVNGSSWYEMTDQGEGIWSASYDWTRLARDTNATLNIRLKNSAGVERMQGYAIRVGSEYPNQPPTLADQTQVPSSGWSLGTVALTCRASDDKADINRGEWFVDGARVSVQNVGWTSSASFAYNWDASKAGYGEHLLRCKVSDRFGRVVRTDRRSVIITPPPPVVSTSYSVPDVILNWTTGTTGLQSEIWRSNHPVGPQRLDESELIGETNETSYTDDDAGLTLGLWCYQVRTRSTNGVYSFLSNEVGKFSYQMETD